MANGEGFKNSYFDKRNLQPSPFATTSTGYNLSFYPHAEVFWPPAHFERIGGSSAYCRALLGREVDINLIFVQTMLFDRSGSSCLACFPSLYANIRFYEAAHAEARKEAEMRDHELLRGEHRATTLAASSSHNDGNDPV